MQFLPADDRRQKIWALVLPILGAMLSQIILNWVDTAMVGHLGETALAAVGIGGFLNFVAMSFVMGLSSAVQALAARKFGAGDQDLAVPLNGGLLLTVLLGIPIVALMMGFGETLFYLVAGDQPKMAAVVETGLPYLLVRNLSVFAIGFNFAFRGHFSAINQTKLYLYTLVSMHIVNIFLHYGLIYGKFGMPELGVYGAGLSTTLSLYFGSFIYFILGFSKLKSQGFLQKFLSKTEMKQLWQQSLPSCAQNLLFAMGFSVQMAIIARIGAAEVAAANALITISLTNILVGAGFGMAATSLVGQALGRKDAADAYQWAWDVCKLAILVFLSIGVVMAIFPSFILGLLMNEAHLIELGILPLRLIGIFAMIDGIGLVLMNALLGAHQSGLVMRIAVGLQWLFFLPLAYVIGPILGFGLLGVWLLMMVWRGIQTGIFVYYWQRQKA